MLLKTPGTNIENWFCVLMYHSTTYQTDAMQPQPCLQSHITSYAIEITWYPHREVVLCVDVSQHTIPDGRNDVQ